MVLPCPGVSACAAPKTNAMPIAATIIHGVICCWGSSRVSASVGGAALCKKAKQGIIAISILPPSKPTPQEARPGDHLRGDMFLHKDAPVVLLSGVSEEALGKHKRGAGAEVQREQALCFTDRPQGLIRSVT